MTVFAEPADLTEPVFAGTFSAFLTDIVLMACIAKPADFTQSAFTDTFPALRTVRKSLTFFTVGTLIADISVRIAAFSALPAMIVLRAFTAQAAFSANFGVLKACTTFHTMTVFPARPAHSAGLTQVAAQTFLAFDTVTVTLKN